MPRWNCIVTVSVTILLVVLAGLSQIQDSSAMQLSGQCGDDAYWKYDVNKAELEVYGTGDMWDLFSANCAPWIKSVTGDDLVEKNCRSIVIGEGITHLGEWYFHELTGVERLDIRTDKVKEYGEFDGFVNLKEVKLADSDNYCFDKGAIYNLNRNGEKIFVVACCAYVIEYPSTIQPRDKKDCGSPVWAGDYRPEVGIFHCNMPSDDGDQSIFPTRMTPRIYVICEDVEYMERDCISMDYYDLYFISEELPLFRGGKLSTFICSKIYSYYPSMQWSKYVYHEGGLESLPYQKMNVNVELVGDGCDQTTVDYPTAVDYVHPLDVKITLPKDHAVKRITINGKDWTRYYYYDAYELNGYAWDGTTLSTDYTFENQNIVIETWYLPDVDWSGANVEWSLNDGTLTITGSGGIPNYQRGGSPWYASRGAINNLVIGDGITGIGTYALADLSIETVVLPNSLSIISDHAFAGCSALQTLTYGSDLTHISDTAFEGCTSFSTTGGDSAYLFSKSNVIYRKSTNEIVTIPQGLTNLVLPSFLDVGYNFFRPETNPFMVCDRLESIESELEDYPSHDGYVTNSLGNNIVMFPRGRTGSFVVPEDIRYMSYALIGSSLESLTITGEVNLSNVRLADDDYPNDSLRTLILGSGVTSGEYFRFTNLIDGCSRLESIIVDPGNPYYASDEYGNYIYSISNGALEFINPLAESMTLPEEVISIRDLNSPSLRTLVMVGVTQIGHANFYAPALESLTYGPSFDATSLEFLESCHGIVEFISNGNAQYPTRSDGCVYSSDGMLVAVPSAKTGVMIPNDVVSIYDGAFRNCGNLESVTIGDSITELPAGLFSNCPSLRVVNMPDTITIIGERAFSGTAIEAIDIPASVTFLDNRTFQDCIFLTEVNLPAGLTSIRSYVFQGCTNLTDVDLFNVTSLGEYCFGECVSLTGMTIPSSMKTIGRFCFYGCTSLTEVTIESTQIKAIDNGTFQSSGLETLTLPSSVRSIGDNAFSACKDLREIILPSSVNYLGENAFSQTEELEMSMDLSNVTHIGDWCFIDSGITSVTLNPSLTQLGMGVFKNCTKLETAVLPTALTSIGSEAFSGCTSITTLEYESQGCIFGDSSYYGCTSLTEVNIIGGVLKNGVFQDSGVRNVVLGGFTEIGDYCFAQCENLRTVTIPSATASIGHQCFIGCTSLTQVNIGEGNQNYSSDGRSLFKDGGTKLVKYYCGNTSGSYVIPDTVTDIMEDAFYSSANLGTLTIGENVPASFVCAESFQGCVSLATIEVSNMHRGLSSFDGVVYSKDMGALYYAPPSIKTCIISSDATAIASKAFYGCRELTSVRFPANLRDIGESAFSGCTALTSINLPSVTSVGAFAFFDCKSVTKIVFGSTSEISFGKDCFDLGRDEVVVASSFEDGFLDKYLGITKASYVPLDVDDRSEEEKILNNIPLIAGGIVAVSACLIAVEVVLRRRR